MLRCEVIMFLALNALKCRSHSAEDAGITNNLRAQSDNKGYICSCAPTSIGDQKHHFQHDTVTAQSHNFEFPSTFNNCLTSPFSTNMAISETKGQGWKVIRTQ